VTAGIVADRYFSPPLPASLLILAAALAAWLFARTSSKPRLPLAYLALAGAAFGAAYHHYRRDVYPADDIGEIAPATPRPAELRGLIDEEPTHTPAVTDNPLVSRDRPETSAMLLRVTHLKRGDDWLPLSGRVRLQAPGDLTDLHVGDEIEAVGRLSRVAGPANPGEFDYADHLRDRGVRAQLIVHKTRDGVVRLERRWPTSPGGCLAVLRGWGQGVLGRVLPPEQSGVAMALLLGEGSPLTRDDWERYIRTGVIHVLAISGYHFVVLAAALWWVVQVLGARRRRAAVFIAALLLGYALLTGGRPPALRAAVEVCAACGAIVLRRRTLAANLFALAWLTVALIDPMDLFTIGCQLSFLGVAVLLWGFRQRARPEPDPLDQLIEQSRPAWQRALIALGRWLGRAYLVTLALWLAVAPLTAARHHLLAPIGLLLGPPLAVLASIALLFGFALLALAAVWEPLAHLAAPMVRWSLAGCEWLVNLTDGWPGSHVYIGEVPEWWLWVFVVALLAALTQEPLRRRAPAMALAGLGWLCVGLISGAVRLPDDELRCTFLAVGHGGCTVIETPDGRVLLYDAGAIAGPDVTRRQIAPFLWRRGVRRIDEVILSHADLDHFNGLPALLERFSVGQVTCTPTFADKDLAAVGLTLEALRRRGVPVRTVKVGDRLTLGPATLEVLHPPGDGTPHGPKENLRSLVLCLTYQRATILLTGDLEEEGLDRVVQTPAPPLDVLMGPHHGSKKPNKKLAEWARPRVVVFSQADSDIREEAEAAYQAVGARVLSTAVHGAVTVRSRRGAVVIDAFVTGERLALRARPQD
jgi:competence protein ComEC